MPCLDESRVAICAALVHLSTSLRDAWGYLKEGAGQFGRPAQNNPDRSHWMPRMCQAPFKELMIATDLFFSRVELPDLIFNETAQQLKFMGQHIQADRYRGERDFLRARVGSGEQSKGHVRYNQVRMKQPGKRTLTNVPRLPLNKVGGGIHCNPPSCILWTTVSPRKYVPQRGLWCGWLPYKCPSDFGSHLDIHNGWLV